MSRPDQALAQAHGATAAFFLVDVTTKYLSEIGALIDAKKLKTHVGAVLPLRDAREAHLMLEGILHRPKGKIVLATQQAKN